jgi:hypothetical protein
MYYSYVEIEYVAMSFSPARMDLALKLLIDDTIHRADDAMTTTSEDKLKVWGYVMTQYNLKPGLRKFGNKGEMAAVNELTQLHVMDT